jgi:chemotaxis response regulator CheB
VVSNADSHNANSHNVDQNVDLRAAVAIGASAGGIEALSRLAAGLSRSCRTHDW